MGFCTEFAQFCTISVLSQLSDNPRIVNSKITNKRSTKKWEYLIRRVFNLRGTASLSEWATLELAHGHYRTRVLRREIGRWFGITSKCFGFPSTRRIGTRWRSKLMPRP